MNKHVRNIIIIFIIVILLELTVFNFRSFRVLNSKNSITYAGSDIAEMEPEAYMSLFQIYNVDEEIKTIHIETKGGETVTYEIACNDETMSIISALPTKVYIEDFENSKYMSTYLSRKNRYASN